MNAYRITDPLVSKSLPFLHFLAPSAINTTTNLPLRLSFHSVSRRCLVTRTDSLQASSATAEDPNHEGNNVTGLATGKISPSTTQQSEPAVAGLLDRLPLYRNQNTNLSPSRRPRLPYASVFDSPSTDSATLLERALPALSSKSSSALGTDTKFPNPFREDDFIDTLETIKKLEPLNPPVRLDAFVGRSELVDPGHGVDFARALAKVQMKCNYNNIKGDQYRQMFHERPGLKRKRLKSERWRKKFKVGFTALVGKVQKLRSQGW